MMPPGLADLPEAAPSRSVLRNSGFVRLWSAQFLSQTAQNGLLFVLLVLVTERTNSSVSGSLLVLAFMLPSIFLSIPAGVLVDRWRKRTVLVATNALRAAMAVLFIVLDRWVPALLLLTLVFSSVGQFFTPAESATIPVLVPRKQLISANALFQLTLTGSQFVGLVLLAPALLRMGGPALFFGASLGLFAASALLVAALPLGIEPERSKTPLQLKNTVRDVIIDVRDTLHAMRGDPVSVLALVQLTMSGSLAMLFGLLVPRFVRDVLDLSADSAVFVFAPLALGAVAGLRLLRYLTERMPNQRVVTYGMFGIAASLVGLGAVRPLGAVLSYLGAGHIVDAFGSTRAHFAPFTLTTLVVVTMVASIPMGFFYALVNAPAQTIVHERAPEDMRGRYFGTQMLLANCAALLLLLVVGAAADAIGVTRVLLLFAPVVLAVALYGLVSRVR
ncbi:MAG: MFS transporter [Dehalococcoidia bacterium]